MNSLSFSLCIALPISAVIYYFFSLPARLAFGIGSVFDLMRFDALMWELAG